MCEFYRPPNSKDSEFFENLHATLECQTKLKLDINFMCCDQNYDLMKSSQHKSTHECLSLMLDNGYVPYIIKPTRITHRSSSLIDNIYMKTKKLRQNLSFVIVDGMSDHFPCLLSVCLKEILVKTDVVIEKRKITDEALLKIQQSLLFTDWLLLNELNVNEAYEYLNGIVIDSLDRFAPKKQIRIRRDECFREGWLTVKLKKYGICVECRPLSSDSEINVILLNIIIKEKFKYSNLNFIN